MINKMLIIDDSEEVCFAIAEFFRLKKWSVTTKNNIETSLEIVREINFDIILIDYNMPHINGVVGSRLLRQIDKNVQIIALTITDEESVAEEFFIAGVNDFVIKPIKMLDLYYRVNLHLTKNRSIVKKEKIVEEIRKLPKGVDKNTLSIIEQCFEKEKIYLGVEEIKEMTGIASKTINRYLKFLDSTEKFEVKIIYGKIGRPKKKYKTKE
jgi:hypothetical protein